MPPAVRQWPSGELRGMLCAVSSNSRVLHYHTSVQTCSIMLEVTPQKPGVYNLSTSFRHIACHHPFTSTVEAAVCLRICVIAHLDHAHTCLLVPSSL
jgi:hypothetical protein